jgi:myb proto-oncogene protein
MKQAGKRKFTPEEDVKLIGLINRFGTSSWIVVKRYFFNRTTRQLRDRWHLYLDPRINKGPWTKEEDQLLIEIQQQFGNSWKQIQQRFFPNRTDISIRNRFLKIQKMNDQNDDLTSWIQDFFSSEENPFFEFE